MLSFVDLYVCVCAQNKKNGKKRKEMKTDNKEKTKHNEKN